MTNPSRYRLPQACSPDRSRARRATLELQRRNYLLREDEGPGHPRKGFRLPPAAAFLPPGESFTPEKKFRLLKHKAFVKLQAPLVKLSLARRSMDRASDYRRVLGLIRRPAAVDLWLDDEEFARQRLTGVNPMSIERCSDVPDEALASAADRVLSELHGGTRLGAALDSGRLFQTDYRELQNELVQSRVKARATLAAPTCLFYVNQWDRLSPLAIQLAPPESPRYATVTPLDGRGCWLMARAHAQAADAHYHEAIYHLLETHFVSELFALCTARHLHPDHPLSQLLKPHFQGNLAINHLARRDLLSFGGAIDTVMAAGVGGALDAARLAWSKWSFAARRLETDLAQRGVEDAKALPGYTYREDALALRRALEDYVTGIVGVWYREPENVREDGELQAWADELARHVPGFAEAPDSGGRRITSVKDLIAILTDIIFRASAQHAAVNMGQFQAYGFVPNAPGTVFAGVPKPGDPAGPLLDEHAVLHAMPGVDTSLAQIAMSWILSEPTHRSLLTSGESPAFEPDLFPEAAAAVRTLRACLVGISARIEERNAAHSIPYTYLNPHNVARSTSV